MVDCSMYVCSGVHPSPNASDSDVQSENVHCVYSALLKSGRFLCMARRSPTVQAIADDAAIMSITLNLRPLFPTSKITVMFYLCVQPVFPMRAHLDIHTSAADLEWPIALQYTHVSSKCEGQAFRVAAQSTRQR